jgi:hypothetical protein
MDKTIEVVLVAVVVIATAAIMLFIFTGESSNFSDFVSNATAGAEEDLEETRGETEETTSGGNQCVDNPDNCAGRFSQNYSISLRI